MHRRMILLVNFLMIPVGLMINQERKDFYYECSISDDLHACEL